MTIEALMDCIRARLEATHGLDNAQVNRWDILESDEPSPDYQEALARLVAIGEVEEFTNPGGEDYSYYDDAGQIVEKVSLPHPALRLIGEAMRRAEERYRFWDSLAIQDTTHDVFFHVPSVVRGLAAHSSLMPSPTPDSLWWEIGQSRHQDRSYWWESGLRHRRDEVPISRILAGDWCGPVVLPMRVTREDFVSEGWEDAELHSIGGIYPLNFDFTVLPEEGKIYLVARLSEEMYGLAPTDGVYVWGFVRTVEEPRKSLPEPVRETPRISVLFGTDTTVEKDPFVLVAETPPDATIVPLMGIALLRAGLHCVRGSSEESCQVWVRASERERAIPVLAEDARQHDYRIVFAIDAG